MHSIWPLLWIWAFWYKEDTVSETVIVKTEDNLDKDKEIAALKGEIKVLEEKLSKINEINNK